MDLNRLRDASGRSPIEPAVAGKQLRERRRSREHRGGDRGILLGGVRLEEL